MSDDDDYIPRHIFYALGLLNSDKERDYENENVDFEWEEDVLESDDEKRTK